MEAHGILWAAAVGYGGSLAKIKIEALTQPSWSLPRPPCRVHSTNQKSSSPRRSTSGTKAKKNYSVTHANLCRLLEYALLSKLVPDTTKQFIIYVFLEAKTAIAAS